MSFDPIKNKSANKILATDSNNETTVKNTSGSGDVVLKNNSDLTGTTSVVDLQASGIVTLSADPVSALQAVTKQYADALVNGLDPKKSVRVTTDSALPSCTYNNGTSGLGATLTADSNGSLPSIDGITLSVNDRLLVKDQISGLQNGIYQVTQLGDVSNPFILTRTIDADNSPSGGEVTPGMYTFIEEGTLYSDSGWVLITNGTITIGTTSLSFSQFSGAGQIIAGAGLVKSGNTLNIGTADVSRIVVNADNIDLATTGVSAGTFTKVTVDLYGRVTSGTSIGSSDITTSLGYTPLNKAGDTITGNLLLGTAVNILADDGVSTLGDNTHRFATLFMSSVINIKSGSSLQIGHASDDLVVHSSGRVLIGTGTDDGSNKLQVSGDIKVTGSSTSSDFSITNVSNSVKLQLFSGSASAHTFINLGRTAQDAIIGIAEIVGRFSDVAAIGDMIVISRTGHLILSSQNASSDIKLTTGSSDTEKMIIKNSGRILIGTTTDDGSNKLQVSGGLYVSGTITAVDITMSGVLSVNPLDINAATVSNRDIRFRTNGVSRWVFRTTNDAEAGSNAGSNFNLIARNDDGTQLDVPLIITRAAGGAFAIARPVTMSTTLLVSGVLTVSSYIASGTIFGDGSAAVNMVLSGGTGTTRDFIFKTASNNRWILRTSAGTESGSNAGSVFQILARADDGSGIDIPMEITRASGGTFFINRPTSLSSTLELSSSSATITVGNTTQTISGLNISSLLTGLTGTDQRGISSSATFNSSATANGRAFLGQVRTAAAAFTMTSGIGLNILDGNKGAGSTITTLYGIKVEDQTVGSTNYSIHTGIGPVSLGDTLTFRVAGNSADASIWRSSGVGIGIRGVTGSSYDFAIFTTTATGAYLMRNPTGTQSLEFPGTGTNTFTGSVVSNQSGSGTSSAFLASAAAPTITLVVTGAALNEKNWDMQGSATTFSLRTRTDANASGVDYLVATRSGTSVSSLAINTTLTVNTDLGTPGSWGLSTVTSSAGNGIQSLDNIRDHASNIFRIRMRTAGTPITALSIDGGGNITLSTLAGTGTRLVTATAAGVLGNATTIAGTYEYSGIVAFASALTFSGFGTSATASIFRTTTDGVTIRGIDQSTNAFALMSSNGTIMLRNPQGTTGLTFDTNSTFNGFNAQFASPQSNIAHNIQGSPSFTGVSQYGFASQATFNSSATTRGVGIYSAIITAATSFTMASGIALHVDVATKGAGSTITTLYGLKVEDQTQGGTNYAIFTGLGTVQFGDNVTLANGNLSVDWTRVGNDVRTLIRNNDNTNAASNAISYVIVGGTSAGDPYSRYSVSGVKDWSVGIDNSDSQSFVVSESGSPGTNNRLKIAVGGAVSIPGTLNVTGLITTTSDSIRISTSKTPSSASDTGTQGQIAWDSGFIYVCTATNTWKRVAIATW